MRHAFSTRDHTNQYIFNKTLNKHIYYSMPLNSDSSIHWLNSFVWPLGRALSEEELAEQMFSIPMFCFDLNMYNHRIKSHINYKSFITHIVRRFVPVTSAIYFLYNHTAF